MRRQCLDEKKKKQWQQNGGGENHWLCWQFSDYFPWEYLSFGSMFKKN